MKVEFTREDQGDKVMVVMTFEPLLHEILTTKNIYRLSHIDDYLRTNYLKLDKIMQYGTLPPANPLDIGRKWIGFLCSRPKLIGPRQQVTW